jgi:L-rhamnose mutarotase
MIRRAFTMRLKPGAMAEYKRYHDEIWPELVRQIEKDGIAHISTFERDPDLFLFSEIKDEKAWDRLWNSDIHKKWGEVMEQFMHFKDGKVDFGELREIFHLETGAGNKSRGKRRGGVKKKVAKKSAKKKAVKKRGRR